jgi:hypothetical protein
MWAYRDRKIERTVSRQWAYCERTVSVPTEECERTVIGKVSVLWAYYELTVSELWADCKRTVSVPTAECERKLTVALPKFLSIQSTSFYTVYSVHKSKCMILNGTVAPCDEPRYNNSTPPPPICANNSQLRPSAFANELKQLGNIISCITISVNRSVCFSAWLLHI